MYLTHVLVNILNNIQSRVSYLGLILHTVESSGFVSFAVFDMAEINERRACIEFCLRLGKNAMIQTAFEDESSNAK